MGFLRGKHWSGLAFHSLGYLPDPGVEPGSPASLVVCGIAGRYFTEPPEKPLSHIPLGSNAPFVMLKRKSLKSILPCLPFFLLPHH